MEESQIELARLLIARLERLSVDSRLAHHASGFRRSLLSAMEAAEEAGLEKRQAASARLDSLIHLGFQIVESAAKEMGDRDG